MYDRGWMLINENGEFLTQRKYAEMTFFTTKIKNGELIFFHKKTNTTARIPILNQYGVTLRTKVWSNSCEVQKVDGIGEWFSNILGFRCYLVFLPKKNIRTKATESGIVQNVVGFADKSPVLVTHEASLQELNHRLEVAIPMNRFRPNIVVSGGNAYEEDAWQTIKIGTTIFKTVELCGRCRMINLDQKTGERGKEPLETLTTYRKINQQIKFGMRMSCEVEEDSYPIIRIGDEVC
ncbi:MAG TPA: MOSC domain-containing protein, partial [Phaeodactylibacter sp.]|nr:MOSC domain-containing protein [Phaeodactylibacter sp.]